MVYFPALEPIFGRGSVLLDALDIIEIEPQTFWFPNHNGGDHNLDQRVFERLAKLSQPKLIHGVGLPLASSVEFDPQQIAPWQQSIDRLNPPWVSEHLAFMRVAGNEPGVKSRHSGFLLPPLHCQETVDIAVARIVELRRLSGTAVAFEISPNYLHPQPGEMADGEFFAQVATEADCGIVLDLHNLWCNERNGRQRVQEVMESLPLDRVWEIHLAGGESYEGYWLDAHSDLVPQPVMNLCEQWLPKLENLGALVFEIMPDYVQAKQLSPEQLIGQIQAMKSLWRLRPIVPSLPSSRDISPATTTSMPINGKSMAGVKVVKWEQSLGILVNGREKSRVCADFANLADDPGVPVYKSLIESFRAGTLAEGLTLSYRLLVLTLGENATSSLMQEFWTNHWPEPFAFDEMLGFATFLRQRLEQGTLTVAFLENVLNYELARAQAQQTGKERFVVFNCEPSALLRSLSHGHLPAEVAYGEFEVHVPVTCY
jgi:uncharacterized protein